MPGAGCNRLEKFMTKKEIAASIRTVCSGLLDEARDQQDAALIGGAFLMVAISLYREIGGDRFAAEILYKIADDLAIAGSRMH